MVNMAQSKKKEVFQGELVHEHQADELKDVVNKMGKEV